MLNPFDHTIPMNTRMVVVFEISGTLRDAIEKHWFEEHTILVHRPIGELVEYRLNQKDGWVIGRKADKAYLTFGGTAFQFESGTLTHWVEEEQGVPYVSTVEPGPEAEEYDKYPGFLSEDVKVVSCMLIKD